MFLDEVANLGAQADMTVTTTEDHSRQLGELSVMMQMMQEMMGAQQERLMRMEASLHGWMQCLVARETVVNERLVHLRDRIVVMEVDEEEEGSDEDEDEGEEVTTSMEVDEGSPVVLDLDLDNFGSPELRPTLERCGIMGGRVNRLVRIEEEPLDKVEELVLTGWLPHTMNVQSIGWYR